MPKLAVYRGKGILPFFLWIGLAGLLSACAGQSGRSMNDITRLQRELADLRSFQAEQTAQISALTSELKGINGRVEELEFNRNRAQNSALLGSAPSPQGGLVPFGSEGKAPVGFAEAQPNQPKPVPPPIVPVQELEQDEQMTAALSSEAGRLFYQGLSQLRRAAFSEALALLQEALASSYNTELYPFLLFWVGVSNDAMGDNRSALRAYHELTSGYGKHQRTPLGLLREGSVFIRLRDSASAKLTFEKLIADFPKSAEAAQAKVRLKDVSRK